MSSTMETILARRAVKHYDPEHQMPEDDLNAILSAAMASPTAFNIQHWRFVVVSDPALRQSIRDVAWDQAQVTDASTLIILTGDEQAWSKDPHQYWRNAPEAVQDFLVPAIGQYYEVGAPGRIRTPNLLIRSQVLYPIELPAQLINHAPSCMRGEGLKLAR